MTDSLIDRLSASFRSAATRVRLGGDPELEFMRETIAADVPAMAWSRADTGWLEDCYIGRVTNSPITALTFCREITKAPASHLTLAATTTTESRWIRIYRQFTAQQVTATLNTPPVYGPSSLVVSEQKDAAQRSLRVVWHGGSTEHATITARSRWTDIHGYVALFVRAAADGGDIYDSNHLSFVKDPRTFLSHRLATNGRCKPIGPGCFDPDENHGASLLDSTVRLGIPLDATVNVGGAIIPVRTIFAGYRYAIMMPADPDLGRFPQIAHRPLRDVIDHPIPGLLERGDIYQFLAAAMVYLPYDQWDTPWRTFEDRKVSLTDIMDCAVHVYLHTWDSTQMIDHSVLHPEILVQYYARQGRDPRPFQNTFLTRELSRDVSTLHPSEVGHYTQTLGALLSHPALQWSAADQQQTQQWLNQLRTRLFELGFELGLEQKGVPYEVTHLLRGLKEIVTTHHAWIQ